MAAYRALIRAVKSSATRRSILEAPRHQPLCILSSGFHSDSVAQSASVFSTKWLSSPTCSSLSHSHPRNTTFQNCRFLSISSEIEDKESNQSTNGDSTAPEKSQDADAEPDLSMDDLAKLLAEKEELLKLKHKEIETMQDKVLRSYAEMENVLDRTKREAENSKKFAIQNFAKNLLDVADNLGRASSVVTDSFSKIDVSKDSVGAVPLLKTLLEGVDMTNKQLVEVFRKFGVEKFDPVNELFDPHRHYAVFQVPDASKPAGTIAAVLKSGYMLHDRVLRPAEVGVTEATNNESEE